MPSGSILHRSNPLACATLAEFSKENTVLWAYGKQGWPSARAEYRTFLTYRYPGTGAYQGVAFKVHSSISAYHDEDEFDRGEFIARVTFHWIRIHIGDDPRQVKLSQ